MPQAEATRPSNSTSVGLLVALAALLEDARPDVLGVLEHDADELGACGSSGGGGRLGPCCCCVCGGAICWTRPRRPRSCRGSAPVSMEMTMTTSRPMQPKPRARAAGHAHAPTVLDVAALLTTLPAHGGLRLDWGVNRVQPAHRPSPIIQRADCFGRPPGARAHNAARRRPRHRAGDTLRRGGSHGPQPSPVEPPPLPGRDARRQRRRARGASRRRGRSSVRTTASASASSAPAVAHAT